MLKKVSFIFSACIIGFCITLGIYLFFTKQHIEIISPLSTSKFSLEQQPSQSLTGKLDTISGTVLWQSRVANEAIPITQPQSIQQGEEVDTGSNGSMTITFPTILTLSAGKNTQLAIIQTLPANIVLQQKTGEVTYRKLDSHVPLSVRGLDLLITENQGGMTVSVDKDTSLVTSTVTDGSITIAYTDTNNSTVEETVHSGEKILFNNNTKEVISTP